MEKSNFVNYIKIYGFNSDEISQKTKSVLIHSDVRVDIVCNRFDCRLTISSQNEQNCLAATRKLAQLFNLNMYSDTDKTLAQTLIQCCTLFNKKLSIFDNGTNGHILNKISQSDPSGNCLKFCFVVPTLEQALDLKLYAYNELKNKKLLCESIAAQFKNSSEILSIAVIADNARQHICVGNAEFVNSFEQNFKSDDEFYTDDLSNTAIFYAIKNFRQNNLNFYANSI